MMERRMASMNVKFTYAQVLDLAMQLSVNDRYALCRDLTRTSRSNSLRRICKAFRTDALSEEEIRQECEMVRTEMYEERMRVSHG